MFAANSRAKNGGKKSITDTLEKDRNWNYKIFD